MLRFAPEKSPRARVVEVLRPAEISYLHTTPYDGRYDISRTKVPPQRFHPSHSRGVFSRFEVFPENAVFFASRAAGAQKHSGPKPKCAAQRKILKIRPPFPRLPLRKIAFSGPAGGRQNQFSGCMFPEIACACRRYPSPAGGGGDTQLYTSVYNIPPRGGYCIRMYTPRVVRRFAAFRPGE